MSQNSWFEHFKEQLQGLTEAYESSGSSLSLLGYALQEQRLRSDEFLLWAVASYKLPRLQSRFFTETPLSQEMFAKWATHYRWSAECLPVAEWDGSLIVACLQPPQDFPSFPSAVLVLAEPQSLSQAWDYFHPERVARLAAAEIEAKTVVQTKEDIPEGIDLSAATTSTKKSDSFSFDDLGVSSDAVSEATNSGVEISDAPFEESSSDDALVGLFESSSVVKLESFGSAAPTPIGSDSVSDIIIATETVSTPMPETSIPKVTLEKTVVLEKPAPENTSSGLTALGKIPPAPNATGVVKTNTPGTPPPPPAPEAEMPFEETFGNHPSPIVAKPAGIARPTVNPVASGNFSLEKLKKKNTTITEKIKVTLSEMKTYFDKSMILTIDEQESQIVAFAWDENFKDIKDTSMRFPLKTPSMFNIVVSTQKPYHGYVALNEINERFFDDWNQGKVPDHITISPMMMDDKIVGLLVGFADKTAYNKVSLNLVEKLSSEFVKGLQAA